MPTDTKPDNEGVLKITCTFFVPNLEKMPKSGKGLSGYSYWKTNKVKNNDITFLIGNGRRYK